MTVFQFSWQGLLRLIVVVTLLSGCSSSLQPRSEASVFNGLLTKGKAYLQRGKPQTALVALEKAQGLQPEHLELLSYLGIAYDQVGQSGQALLVWRKAHALKPESGAISHNLGVALMRKQLLDAAEVALKGALADPEFTDRGETYYNLAIIQQRRGSLREMVADLEQVLQIDQNHIPAHQVLADHYRKMRRPDLEENHLRNILAIDSDSISTLERLADLLLQSGQTGPALPLLERIQMVAPDSEAARRAESKQERILDTD